MTSPLLIDPGAAGLAVAADELIGPLADAAVPRPVPWSAGARVVVDMVTRMPLVLATLLDDLDTDALAVTVALVPGGEPEQPQPQLRYAPWTEHGTALYAYRPATDPDGTAASFTLHVTASRTDANGTVSALTDQQVAAAVRLDLVQGVLGRLLVVLLSEKPRLRREARELVAMRALRNARADVLDRLGEDLGCPRFADELSWDPTHKQVGTVPLSPPGTVEPDSSYRDRLKVLRGWRLPTPPWIDNALNGPGAPTDPGAGWLADVGVSGRLTVDETPNPLLVAFRLVSPGRPKARAQLLDAVRRIHLVWPAGSAAGNAAHAARMLTPAARAPIDAARSALATLGTPAGQPICASLAYALQKLVERQSTMGAHPYTTVLTGQRDDGGSRYELGLGAQLKAPNAAELGAAVTAAQNAADPDLVPVPVVDDPVGAWLLRACGMATAQQLVDGSVYVSTLATGGLVVDISPGPDAAVPEQLAARIETTADANHDAPLAGAIAALEPDGLTPVANPAPLVAGMKATASDGTLRTAVLELGLPEVVNVADVQTRLGAVAARDWVAFDLGPGVTADIKTDPSKLAELLGRAARGGASSGLPVITSTGTLALILGVVDLPLAGNNLAAEHSVAYRWQVRGLARHPARLTPRRGSAVTLTDPGEGISVVVCQAYVRDGGNDPYQWRPTLPPETLLSLRQYEHLMNIVELVTPLGVRADTWAIRRSHIDVNASNSPTPLPPSAARTYRRYRPQR